MSDFNIISLGAGVQSSCMAFMAAKGMLSPMPDCAIFADTQCEPDWVYEYLEYIKKNVPFDVFTVTAGSLRDTSLVVRTSKKQIRYIKSAIPMFIKSHDGKIGLLKRQCTTDFKIKPLFSAEKRIAGKGTGITQWIGISLDEASRMKPSRDKRIANHYPLIDAGMTRADCLRWLQKNGYKVPHKSACIFCPYHNNREWQFIKENSAKHFNDACDFERDMQTAMKQVGGFYGVPFLHRQCIPLGEIDFLNTAQKEFNFFNNECEGMCGV